MAAAPVTPAFARPFVRHASSATRRHINPWALAAARQKRAANISRQQELKAQRAAALGNPLRGDATPFMESLAPGKVAVNMLSESARWDALSAEEKTQRLAQWRASSNPDETSRDVQGSVSDTLAHSRLNYFLTQGEVETVMRQSELMTTPPAQQDTPEADPAAVRAAARRHRQQDAAAREAIRRIVSLQNGNNKDLTRLNISRCIEEFGRHNTDAKLDGKLPAYDETGQPQRQQALIKTRLGPDTGSSEVQVAILTAKIEVLSHQLEHTSHKDKHNKRNLRLLVHRRQKLLKYLRRKERGGPRWQNLMQSLGLADASWKGEISL
ncbi:hypothetical protein KEM52_000787 [Ascosphaera acerosa]|nr:hypothetical protein KEM52_000787 [Ascosphaera acerosa]